MAITSIDKWLLDNRPWRREHNIAFAALKLTNAVMRDDAKEKAFWQLVLERLEG